MKENDVFGFRWNSDAYDNHRDPNWCFGGILIAMPDHDGVIKLYDTYWGIQDKTHGGWTEEEAQQRGQLTLRANLEDLIRIDEYQQHYYKEGDLVFLSSQHGCVASCRHFFVKRSAIRSQEAMQYRAESLAKAYRDKAEWYTHIACDLDAQREKITNGDLGQEITWREP